jgi:hypothetical protein
MTANCAFPAPAPRSFLTAFRVIATARHANGFIRVWIDLANFVGGTIIVFLAAGFAETMPAAIAERVRGAWVVAIEVEIHDLNRTTRAEYGSSENHG